MGGVDPLDLAYRCSMRVRMRVRVWVRVHVQMLMHPRTHAPTQARYRWPRTVGLTETYVCRCEGLSAMCHLLCAMCHAYAPCSEADVLDRKSSVSVGEAKEAEGLRRRRVNSSTRVSTTYMA